MFSEDCPERGGRPGGPIDVTGSDCAGYLDGEPDPRPVRLPPGVEDEVGKSQPHLLVRGDEAALLGLLDAIDEARLGSGRHGHRIDGPRAFEPEPLAQPGRKLVGVPVLKAVLQEQPNTISLG